ncbi:MAG: hypothetical protein N2115_01840 [bacterium]|nr:hypothetical protein [bacterium]
MKNLLYFSVILLGTVVMADENVCDILIKNTKPIITDIDKRLPIFVWAHIPEHLTEQQILSYLKQLDERKIVLLTGWRIPKEGEKTGIQNALKIDMIRKQLNLPVFIDASGIVYMFFDGSEQTAHINDEGKPFFDTSFSKEVKIGCPFRIETRYRVIAERIENFLKAYKKEGIDIKYWAVDWEVDGPIEWNNAWENSKKCMVCRKNIKNIDDFYEFQKAVRGKRAELQKEVFVKTVSKYYPECLIGNYAVNPHDGYRYWWDYFEKETKGAIYQKKQDALHRKWFDEFRYSGYTMAMPVIYTWYRFFQDYNFEPKEYRWFYPLMKEATSVGKNTSSNIPVITFVHWQTVSKPKNVPADFVPLSRGKYKELLWHLLLRGHDAFCLWSPINEMAEEIKVVHEVYAESLKYNDFILKGKPVFWDVPEEPDTIISGMKLNEKLLFIRSDFKEPRELKIKVDGRITKIPVIKEPAIMEIK